MRNLSLVFALVLVFGVSISAKAVVVKEDNKAEHEVKVQIPQYALVGLSSTSSFTLAPKAPETAGLDIQFSGSSISDNTKWLNYSYLGSTKDKQTTISVKMETVGNSLPAGIGIGLTVGAYEGQGKGSLGQPENNGEIDLTSNPTRIVKNIKNCYTGSGAQQGHRLTYTLKKKGNFDYSELVAGSYTVNIVYTITD